VDFERLLGGLASAVLAGCAAWFWAVTTLVTFQAARGGAALRRPVPACPGVVRRWVLVACGVAVVSGMAAPAATATATLPAMDQGYRTVVSSDTAVASLAARVNLGYGNAAEPDPDHAHGSPRPPQLDGLPLPDRSTDQQPDRHPDRHPEQARPRPVGEAHRPALLVATVQVRPGDSLWSLAAATLPDGASNTEIAHRWNRLYELNRHLIGSDPDLILAGRTFSVPTWGEETAR
jgi:nucleoid-associated protein YgaU